MPLTLVKGVCPLDCQDSCAWVARVENGRVTGVEGAKDHPFTRGTLCAKVNDYEERTYAADRLLHPLIRTGAKGAGEFRRAAWDEALDAIAGRFRAILASDGPEALMPLNYLGSQGVVQRRSLVRLFHALGATRVHGSICGASGNALDAEGHPRGFDPETIVESRFILLWGANLLTTSHHHFHFIQEARRRGARVVCLDPRRTRTADACDEHLQLRPGSDTVLAAGMLRLLFEEGLADLEFARGVAGDVDLLSERVAPWHPERVAQVTGLAAADVVRLARAFAAARPATIRCGIAPQQTTHGEEFVRSVSALAILGGHWRLPGGGLFIESYPVFHDQRATRPDLLPGAPRSVDMARLGELLTARDLAPPVKGLMIWGTNPAVVHASAAAVRQGLAREDLFTVVLEHFLTDTARYADVVLPSTTQLEHFDVQGAWGHHYITVNHPAVAPLGESKSHGEVMRLLARRLGLQHPALQESDEAIAASAVPPGVDFEALKAEGWVKHSPPAPSFGAVRGALKLAFQVATPLPAPGGGALQLLTPKSHHFMNSSFGNMARQRRAMGRPTLDIHPSDAGARGLADGQRVVIRNGQGAVRAWLQVTDRIHPGVVSLPGKWWSQPAETGAMANLLTPAAWSPGGQPAYNEAFVDVAAAD